jgi:hypothetical protein
VLESRGLVCTTWDGEINFVSFATCYLGKSTRGERTGARASVRPGLVVEPGKVANPRGAKKRHMASGSGQEVCWLSAGLTFPENCSAISADRLLRGLASQ